MLHFSKKLLLLACFFMVPVVIAKKTKKLQLFVVPSDPSYIFALNDGNGISTNPAGIRPQGSYYETNVFIFPGGTVSKSQTDFSIDKNGNPINLNDNLGMAYFISTLLQTVDFSNTPPAGTLIEQSEFRFNFKNACNGINNLYAMGFAAMGTFPPQTGKSIITAFGGVVGGSGCNQDNQNNSFTAEIYLAQTGSVVTLIEIKFDKEIEY